MAPQKREYELVPDVEHVESPLMSASPKSNSQRRRSKICSRTMIYAVWRQVGLVVVIGAMLGAVAFVFLHSSSYSLQPRIDAARDQVHVNKYGSYYVTYPDEVPQNMTFAELAERMLPPWYEATLMAIEDHLNPQTMDPTNIGTARKAFLMTRNLMDAFSPVYSEFSLWKRLRKQIDRGYEKLGHLQDLDHSGADYSKELLQLRLQEVINWKVGFGLFRQRHHVRQFVYKGASPKQCAHHKSSHLFWSDMETLPCGDDLAEDAVQNLGRAQLINAAAYWEEVQNFESVLSIENEEEFHNLRKELRIFLDEYHLFGDVLLRTPDEDLIDTLETAQTKLGYINDAWTARQIYITRGTHPKEQKELASEIDGLWEDFKAWAEKHDLTEAIDSALDMLS